MTNNRIMTLGLHPKALVLGVGRYLTFSFSLNHWAYFFAQHSALYDYSWVRTSYFPLVFPPFLLGLSLCRFSEYSLFTLRSFLRLWAKELMRLLAH